MDGAELLRHLAGLAGVSGAEGAVAAAVRAVWEPLCDEVRTDALGNVIALLRADAADGGRAASAGRPPRVAVAAHTDEIGLVVTKIEDGGFLRVAAIGGIDRRYLPGLPVRVHGRSELAGLVGTLPPHLTAADSRNKPVDLSDAFVDVGLDAAEVRRQVRVGDRISMCRTLRPLLGAVVTGKALDDRAGVAALHEALLRLRLTRRSADVLLIATVQEEAGLRGAATAAYGEAPDVGIAVDVTFAAQPGVSEHDGAAMGGGPALAQGANFHPEVVAALRETARREGVAVQLEYIAANSGTDAWAMQVARDGVPCGLLSVPLRYMHSPVETLDMRDVRETGRLLAAFLSRVDRPWVEGLCRVLK